jgi:hypothetical protein
MNFLNYIRGSPGKPSFEDNYHKVLYVVANVSQELSLFKIETLKKNIQIVFVDYFYQDFHKNFKTFLETLSPLNRVLLTQHISIVHMGPSPVVSAVKFSIGCFKLNYEEGQRYYSIHKQTSADVRLSLSQDDCFIQLMIESADIINLDIVTNQV